MNMQVTDWNEHYKAVQKRISGARKAVPVYTVPARLRLGRERYFEPIGPVLGDAQPIERDVINLAPSKPTFARIRDEKLSEHGITLAQFNGAQRHPDIVKCRREVWYEVHQQTTMSLPQIGRLSHRDHTTVLHGIRREAEIRSGVIDPKLAARREYSRLMNQRYAAKRKAGESA